ncbi:MAG: ParA family protein [Paracoccaceae bacterium]|nr:ParA family protein [Paracoccaceae bacterium]
MAKRISIINFKGGVGKTTLAFHLGTGLARYYDSRVLLIDMDHQSSLSIICLGHKIWDNVVDDGLVVDRVFEPFFGQQLSITSEQAIVKKPKKGHFYKCMDIVPASLSLDDVEIELTSSSQGNAVKSEWNKRTLVCKWIMETGIDDVYDYIIFDCPPATKIVSQNAIAASHGFVIPVVPEAVMERGAPHLRGLIQSGIDKMLNELAPLNDKLPTYVPDTKLAGVVITRIASSSGYSGYTNDHTRHLKSLENEWKNDLLKPYIPQGTGVSECLARGVPVYDEPLSQNIGQRGINKDYEQLTGHLKSRIDRI